MMDHKTHNYMVKLFKILSNSHRLQVLELLLSSKEPLMVNTIAERLNIEQSNLSAHLTRMRDNKIVRAKQDGLNMYYEVSDPNVAAILKTVKWHG